MSSFQIEQDTFLLNGSPFRILSGAIHFFRVFPEQWPDRLAKLKACGLNTVETYVPWNLHEPKPGEYHFAGMCDVGRFLALAHEMGLKAIVRPSPYICAEWEFGGMPAWLLNEPGMRLRCAHPAFLARVDAYYDALMPQLVPHLCTNGGPVIAMQIENEYGSYGNDKTYLRHLADSMKSRGVDVPLFTSDGPEDLMLQGGTLPEVYKTVNFGSRPKEAFEKLKQFQPDAPPMVMEYWIGWFDHWGVPHHRRDAGEVADTFKEMLDMGASVNFYMFHGGTNFGFLNGSNRAEQYEPTVTSYDYDSLLDECGDATDKWFRVRDVLAGMGLADPAYEPAVCGKAAYGKVCLTETAPLFDQLDALSEPVASAFPEPMERYGQDYGYILYRTRLPELSGQHVLKLRGVHDRAQIYLNGAPVAVLERDADAETIAITLTGAGDDLQILVENMGRVNYGEYLADHKGIVDGVRLDHQYLFGWTVRTLPMTDLSRLAYRVGETDAMPAFHRGTLTVETPADTFISMEGWTKGVVWVNGFNLGRFWDRGPTRTLYVPAPLLRVGENEVVVFDQHGAKTTEVTFRDTMDLG